MDDEVAVFPSPEHYAPGCAAPAQRVRPQQEAGRGRLAVHFAGQRPEDQQEPAGPEGDAAGEGIKARSTSRSDPYALANSQDPFK